MLFLQLSHINSTVYQRGNHGDQSYIDAILPFGLCYAPKNFNALADTLQEIVRQKGLAYVEHYVITVGTPHSESDKCAENLLQTCSLSQERPLLFVV